MPQTPDASFFVREIEIECEELTEPLKLYQKTEGDVNCIVWDAAIVLAKYLEKLNANKNGCLSGMNVIELGAGVGCVGLTAACLGANVILTDLEENLSILKQNVEENKSLLVSKDGTATVKALAWGNKIDMITPQKILLADCVYYKESIEPLITTLNDLSNENTEILQSQEIRDTEIQKDIWNHYISGLEKYFYVNEVPLSEQNRDYSSGDIKLFRIHKKPQLTY